MAFGLLSRFRGEFKEADDEDDVDMTRPPRQVGKRSKQKGRTGVGGRAERCAQKTPAKGRLAGAKSGAEAWRLHMQMEEDEEDEDSTGHNHTASPARQEESSRSPVRRSSSPAQRTASPARRRESFGSATPAKGRLAGAKSGAEAWRLHMQMEENGEEDEEEQSPRNRNSASSGRGRESISSARHSASAVQGSASPTRQRHSSQDRLSGKQVLLHCVHVHKKLQSMDEDEEDQEDRCVEAVQARVQQLRQDALDSLDPEEILSQISQPSDYLKQHIQSSSASQPCRVAKDGNPRQDEAHEDEWWWQSSRRRKKSLAEIEDEAAAAARRAAGYADSLGSAEDVEYEVRKPRQKSSLSKLHGRQEGSDEHSDDEDSDEVGNLLASLRAARPSSPARNVELNIIDSRLSFGPRSRASSQDTQEQRNVRQLSYRSSARTGSPKSHKEGRKQLMDQISKVMRQLSYEDLQSLDKVVAEMAATSTNLD